MKRFTKEQLKAYHPCSEYTDKVIVKLFAGRKTMSMLNVLDLDISTEDKIWILSRRDLCTTELQRRYFACSCAASVLHIYEDKYPGDNRPRNAIEAGWLAAAYDAAYTAYTAYTATDATDAADAATTTTAATAAAAAAATTAYAADAAYAAAYAYAEAAADTADTAYAYAAYAYARELQLLFMYEALAL